MARSVKPVTSLKSRKDFLSLRQAPRYSSAEFIMQGNVVARTTADEPEIAVGYTVTKKIGNSVVRNRIKRRLRAAVAIAARNPKLDHDVGQNSPEDVNCSGKVVLIARAGALNQNFSTLVGKMTKGIDHLAAKGNKAG